MNARGKRDHAMITDREQRLAQVKEGVVIGGHRYVIDEPIADTGSGHNVTSIVLLLVSRLVELVQADRRRVRSGGQDGAVSDTAVRAYRRDGEAGAGA